MNEEPPEPPDTAHNGDREPLSLSSLASTVDNHATDVPSFLNELLKPAIPLIPPLPPRANGALAHDAISPSNLASLEQQLNSLITRLSLLSQDTSSALEQSMQDVSRSIPRLGYDLQFMREGANALQTNLTNVQQRVADRRQPEKQVVNGVNGDSGPQAGPSKPRLSDQDAEVEDDETRTHRSLEKLSHLDKLKSRMESARDILREAESWSTLESEITSYIGSSAYDKAGQRLAEASKSMVVFQNTPGEFEDRKALLVSLQNELETAMATALRESIEKGETQRTAGYYKVFELMERKDEFQGYYFAARRAPLVDEWSKATLSDTGTPGEDAVRFTTFLPRFYSSLLSTLSSEKAQAAFIFPTGDVLNILPTFLQSVLEALSPRMQARLASMSDHYGAEALPELIKAYRSTEDLVAGMQAIMTRPVVGPGRGLSNGSALDTTSPTSQTSRKPDALLPTRRQSVSRRFSRPEAPIEESSEWQNAIVDPFLDMQTSYFSLERKHLAHLLRYDPAFTTLPRDNPARTISERATALFKLAEEAVGRCLAFTHGFGANGLVNALNTFVEGFFDAQRSVLDKAGKGKVEDKGGDELDFEGLDYSTEDWAAFQTGLHILEACGDIQDSLVGFEATLTSSILSIVPQITTSTDPNLALLRSSPLYTSDLLTLVQSSKIQLHGAHEALTSFTRSTQLYLQALILRPLETLLSRYPDLPVWNQPDRAPRRDGLSIPSFSLSPTDTIARLSEGLLNLLRVFEVYAGGGLGFSLITLPFVDQEALAIDDQVRPTQTDPFADVWKTLDLPSEAILSTWVSSLCLSLLSSLTTKTLPSISKLSSHGAAQLASDLAYLSNAVRALDVEWVELEKWRVAAEVKDEEQWRDGVRGETGGKEVVLRLGRARGWIL